MNFLTFSPFVFAGGLAALAVGLYLLQQLRIRYTRLPVPTTLFWAEAVRDAPVRVFRQSFKHWWAYLLILLICALLWLGFSNPETRANFNQDFNILVLDGSAHAGVAGQFEESKNQLMNDVGKYPKHHREVYFSGSQNLKLLAPGEDTLILERRLADREPVSARSTVEDQIRLLARDSTDDERERNIIVYGNVPVAQQLLDDLPDNINVSMRTNEDPDFSNRGIVALGVGEPASGDWDKVDVLVRVLNTTDETISPSDLTITVGNIPIDISSLNYVNESDLVLKDVLANGLELVVTLDGEDDLAFDNTANVLLPTRSQITVVLGANVPQSLIPAIEADAALLVVNNPQNAQVAILGPGDADSTLPTLRIVNIQEQDSAFLIGYDGDEDAESALRQSLETLGLNQIDATAIAEEMEREIEVMLELGDERFVSIWQPIVEDEFNFRDSFSFPLFVSKTIRFLSNEEPWYAYLAAGKRPIEQSSGSSLVDTDTLSAYAVGTYFIQNLAGETLGAEEIPGVVSLLDETSTTQPTTASTMMETTGEASIYPQWELITWLLLLALALVFAEWYFYQRRLMP